MAEEGKAHDLEDAIRKLSGGGDEEEIEAVDDSWVSAAVSAWTAVKQGATGVLVLLSRESSQSFFLSKVSISIEFVQVLTIAVQPLFVVPGEAEVFDAVSHYMKFSRLLFVASNPPLLLYACFGLISFVIALAIFVGYRYMRSLLHMTWPIKLLRRTVGLLSTVAFIPLVEVFVTGVLCGYHAGDTCSSGRMTSIAFFLSFLIICIVVTSTQFDPLLTSDSPCAMAHARIATYTLVVRLLLATLAAAWDALNLWEMTELTIWRNIVVFASVANATYLYTWYQPFYNSSMNLWHAGSNAVLLWVSIGTLVLSLRELIYSGSRVIGVYDVAVLTCVGAILVVPMTAAALRQRLATLERTDTFRLKNAFEFELKIRCMLRKQHPKLRDGVSDDASRARMDAILSDMRRRDKPEQGGVDLEDGEQSAPLISTQSRTSVANMRGMPSQRMLTSTNGALSRSTRHLGKSDRATEAAVAEARVLTDVRQQFAQGLRQFHGSAQMCMFQINFFQTFFSRERGMILSRQSLLEARTRRPLPDVEFRLSKLESRLKQNDISGPSVLAFVAGEKYERESRHYDRLACYGLLDFWKEFKLKEPDVLRVQQASKHVADYTLKARRAYEKLLRVQPKSSRLLRLYGNFLVDVVNDRRAGTKLLLRADALSDKGHDGITTREVQQLRPMLLCDMTGRSPGSLNYCNADAARLLNEATHKITEYNVEDFLLPPFSGNLDRIISRFFSHGESAFVGKAVNTFCRTTQNVCVEVEMHLAPYTINGVDFNLFVSLRPSEEAMAEIAGRDDDDDDFGTAFDNKGYVVCLMDDHRTIVGASGQGMQLLERFTTLLGKDSAHMAGIDIGHLGIGMDDLIATPVERLAFAETNSWTPTRLVCAKPEWDNRLSSVEAQTHIYDYEGFRLAKVNLSVEITELHQEDSVALTAAAAALHRSDSWNNLGNDDNNSDADADADPAAEGSYSMYRSSRLLGRSRRSSSRLQGSSAKGNGVATASDAGSESGSVHFRRILVDAAGAMGMSPIIRRLSAKFSLSIFVIGVTAVSYYITQESRMAEYFEAVTFLNAAGFRRFNAVSIAYVVHSMVLLNKGVRLPNNESEASLRKQLDFNLNSLRKIDSQSFAKRHLDESIQREYESRSTDLEYLVGGEHITVESGLFDVTSHIVSAAIQLNEMPLRDFTLDNPLVFFTLSSLESDTGRSFLDRLNATTFLYMDLAENRVENLIPLFMGNALLALVIQCFLLVFFLRPLVSLVERTRVDVLNVLSSIPPDAIEAVANRCKTRLEVVHEVSVEVIEEHYGIPTVDTKTRGSRGWRRKNSKRRGGSKDDDGAGCLVRFWHRFRALLAHAARCSAGSNGTAIGQHKVRSQLPTLLRLSMPGCLAMCFYALNYVFGFYLDLEYLIQVPHSVNKAGLRRATLRLVRHRLYLFLAGTTLGDANPLLATNRSRAIRTVSMFEDVNMALLNGAGKYPGLLSVGSSDAVQLQLLLEDGCLNWREEATGVPTQTCIEFQSGVMSGGLHSASSTVVSTLHDIITVANNTALSSVDLLVHPDLEGVLELEQDFVQPQQITSVQLYEKHVRTLLESTHDLRAIFFGFFVVLSVATYLFVVRDVIKSLDNELKRTRRQLLMIPEELYQRLPSLRDYISREFGASRQNSYR